MWSAFCAYLFAENTSAEKETHSHTADDDAQMTLNSCSTFFLFCVIVCVTRNGIRGTHAYVIVVELHANDAVFVMGTNHGNMIQYTLFRH